MNPRTANSPRVHPAESGLPRWLEQEGELSVTGELDERCLRGTRVGEVGFSRFPALTPDSTAYEVAQVLQGSPVACALVIEEGRPVGLVTRGDMVRILSDVLINQPGAKCLVRDVMTPAPVCIESSRNLQEAFALLREHPFRHFPVLDGNGNALGILTREALLQWRLEAIERERNELQRRIENRSRELTEVNRELQVMALQDSLLNVGNRRAMEMDVRATHLNALRYGQSYSLALLDVDFFKRYNDHYGHCAGDDALSAVADCIRDSIRRGDRVYRYGGEEFLILMPETSLGEATEAVARVTSNLHQLNLEHQSSPHRRLTVSAGVSSFVGDNAGDWKAVVKEADAFLYKAKELGRNQVYGPQGCCWSQTRRPSPAAESGRPAAQ